jgi:hypothetical protein
MPDEINTVEFKAGKVEINELSDKEFVRHFGELNSIDKFKNKLEYYFKHFWGLPNDEIFSRKIKNKKYQLTFKPASESERKIRTILFYEKVKSEFVPRLKGDLDKKLLQCYNNTEKNNYLNERLKMLKEEIFDPAVEYGYNAEKQKKVSELIAHGLVLNQPIGELDNYWKGMANYLLETYIIEKLEKLKNVPAIASENNEFKLTKKISKIDFIRVLDALYQSDYFKNSDGLRPQKGNFMKKVGSFFGVDLSDYDSHLSQAYSTSDVPQNIKIFQKLIEKTTEIVNKKSIPKKNKDNLKS